MKKQALLSRSKFLNFPRNSFHDNAHDRRDDSACTSVDGTTFTVGEERINSKQNRIKYNNKPQYIAIIIYC